MKKGFEGMFLEDLGKLMEIEYINESNLDELYSLYKNNLDYMANKNIKSGEELYNLSNIAEAKCCKFFLIKVGQNYCGLLDCYLDYPKLGDVYINYFLLDKAYHNFEMGKEIMRDFICLALKEYSRVVLDKRANKPQIIEFWNSFGFNVSDGIANLTIQRRDI